MGTNLILNLSIAAAASRSASFLRHVLHVRHDFQEGRSHLLRDGLASLNHRRLHVSLVASAARVGRLSGLGLLVGARGLLAHELALGTRAQSGLLALPVALGLFAHGSAHGVGGSASSAALSGSADSLALGAVSGLAQILGAAHVALRLIAVNLAGSAGGLLAVNLALGALAHRVALSRARGIIALPSALRVASSGRAAFLHVDFHIHGSDAADQQEAE